MSSPLHQNNIEQKLAQHVDGEGGGGGRREVCVGRVAADGGAVVVPAEVVEDDLAAGDGLAGLGLRLPGLQLPPLAPLVLPPPDQRRRRRASFGLADEGEAGADLHGRRGDPHRDQLRPVLQLDARLRRELCGIKQKGT